MTMTTASLLARAHDGVVDEPDPAARPRRRTFTAEYKALILDEYDALRHGSEERGALLRREGLYTSHIAEWRKARDTGARDGLAAKPKPRRSARAGRARTAASTQRAARDRAGEDEAGVGDHGKSTRALGTALRERGLRPEVEAVIDEHFDDLEAVTSTKEACAPAGRVAGHVLPAPAAAGRGPARAAADTTERAHRGRTSARARRCCAAMSTATWHRRRCGPGCSTTASTCARSSTMYRLLAIAGENRERRRQRTHPARKRPS